MQTECDPKEEMELTVSGTNKQEGQPVTQQSMSSQAKTNTNLIRTSLRPIIYTPAQLHEMFAKQYSVAFKIEKDL